MTVGEIARRVGASGALQRLQPASLGALRPVFSEATAFALGVAVGAALGALLLAARAEPDGEDDPPSEDRAH